MFTIIRVKNHQLLVVTSNLHAKLDIDSVAALLILGSFDDKVHLFGILYILAKFLTSIIIK